MVTKGKIWFALVTSVVLSGCAAQVATPTPEDQATARAALQPDQASADGLAKRWVLDYLVDPVPRDNHHENRVASPKDVPERPACCLT